MALGRGVGPEQTSWPSYQLMATETGMSKREMIRRIDQLLQLGLLAKDTRHDADGCPTSNIYTLLDCPAVACESLGSDQQSPGVVPVSHPSSDCPAPEQDPGNKTQLNKTKTKSGEPGKPDPTTRESKTSLDSHRLAQLLADSIAHNNPHAKTPHRDTLTTWATDLDKLHRIDGKDWTLIEQVLAWAVRDPFWSQNILSGRKFREKWNVLSGRACGQRGQRATISQVSDEIDEMIAREDRRDGNETGNPDESTAIDAEFYPVSPSREGTEAATA